MDSEESGYGYGDGDGYGSGYGEILGRVSETDVVLYRKWNIIAKANNVSVTPSEVKAMSKLLEPS